MLSIGQLATYAGTTVRAVRHYHAVGLLPEPPRDHSGYRTYDAATVVQLVRIRTLAEAGVPLARVREVLDAGPAEFARAIDGVDRRLRAEIEERRQHRRRIAALTPGDGLALPAEATAYVERLRGLGFSEAFVDGQRDAWVLIAARMPEQMPVYMRLKDAQLDEPRTLELFRLLDAAIDADPADGDADLRRIADELVSLSEEDDAHPPLDGPDVMPEELARLIDAFMVKSMPRGRRLLELIEARGWSGVSQMERTPDAQG
ncbi:hypothetical protein GCM10011519_23710 [Marmoricola endophyticus]|uniref:HTH merR-type domain-containing protein n=1 Tax=Marmoricola endophyticus TaxID=2040280 RepID=A0A917BKB7_9ACTN|nr:MerR family transcriptional regulator [Marmoricola endophyticus]GGF48964.1 hypothetical protein GCM10011519_23710 [Marmoricola endophyticus]